MMTTDRLQNESFDDYKYRLCKNRTELGLTWPEIGELLGMHHDTVRKQFAEFERGYNYAISSNATSQKEIEALEQKRLQLELERKKIQSVRVEQNKIIREEARRELLFEMIRESLDKVEIPKFEQLPENKGKRQAILGFSDIHFGKTFISTNNIYDVDIARERMNSLLNQAKDICAKEGIDHLHIVNAGDSVEGIALRISQLQALQMGMTDQVINFSRLMVEALNWLSTYVGMTYHHVRSANHTEIRPLGTAAGQFPKEDMERVIHMYIKDMLANNPRITVPDYENSVVRFKVLDYLVYAVHGHEFKGKNVESVIKDMSMLNREFIDVLIIGHYHHSKEVSVYEGTTNNCELLQLPSVMGSDEYSDSLMTGSKPGAKLFLFEENKGKTITYDIKL